MSEQQETKGHESVNDKTEQVDDEVAYDAVLRAADAGVKGDGVVVFHVGDKRAIAIDPDDVAVLLGQRAAARRKIEELEAEIKALRESPIYVSMFQHQQVVAQYQRWATTGRFYSTPAKG